MAVDAATLQKIVHNAKSKAQLLGIDVHPSFGVELANYSLRLGLKELEPREMEVVLEGLAEHALEERPELLDARMLQTISLRLCPHVFRICDGAAHYVLLEKDMPLAAKKVEISIKKLEAEEDVLV
jgi:hypothetical protein